MTSEENLKKIWSEILEDVDILIKHSPPKFIGDCIDNEINTGSETLLEEVLNRLKLKFHIFGHIHDAHGIYKVVDSENEDLFRKDTVFVNACVLYDEY